MALTRKMLEAMGIEGDKVELIITAHTETVDALKEQRDTYKAEAEKVPGLQTELDGFKNGDDYKEKYETLKAQVDGAKAQADKEKAAREYFQSKGIKDEKSLKYSMKTARPEIAELVIENGKIKDASSLDGLIADELSGFISTVEVEGTKTPNPAGTGGGKLSRKEIYKTENGRYVLSASERQAALKKLYEQGE